MTRVDVALFDLAGAPEFGFAAGIGAAHGEAAEARGDGLDLRVGHGFGLLHGRQHASRNAPAGR